MSVIDKILVEKFCNQFPKRRVTMRSLKKIDDKRFHLFGHWNEIHIEDNQIVHSYHNGATGEREKVFSTIDINEIDKHLFIKYERGFILFTNNRKKGFKGIFINPDVGAYTYLNDEHKFLHDNGIEVKKKVRSFDENWMIQYHEINPYKNE